MAFEPGIVVTSSDEPRATPVVEAKVHLPNLERTIGVLRQIQRQVLMA